MDRETRFGREPLDVLVIGAGQAGLVMGWHLARLGVVEAIVSAIACGRPLRAFAVSLLANASSAAAGLWLL